MGIIPLIFHDALNVSTVRIKHKRFQSVKRSACVKTRNAKTCSVDLIFVLPKIEGDIIFTTIGATR